MRWAEALDKGGRALSAAIDRWHEVARARDPSGLDALLADDAVFLSPSFMRPSAARRSRKPISGRPSRCWAKATSATSRSGSASARRCSSSPPPRRRRGRGRRHHRLERGGQDRPLQGDDPADQGDRGRAPADGGGARGVARAVRQRTPSRVFVAFVSLVVKASFHHQRTPRAQREPAHPRPFSRREKGARGPHPGPYPSGRGDSS